MIRTLSAILASLLFTTSVHACTCVTSGTTPQQILAEAYTRADNVFFARVLSARVTPQLDEIEFAVSTSQVFKGRIPLRLTTPIDESACGIDITVGRLYVFFVGNDGGVGLCSESRPRSGSSGTLADADLIRILEGLKRFTAPRPE